LAFEIKGKLLFPVGGFLTVEAYPSGVFLAITIRYRRL
jgi:hypothetical protein